MSASTPPSKTARDDGGDSKVFMVGVDVQGLDMQWMLSEVYGSFRAAEQAAHGVAMDCSGHDDADVEFVGGGECYAQRVTCARGHVVVREMEVAR